MTAPDHRPYLLPTDLRTAEDVARWLRARDEAHEGAETLADAVAALRARLDRERRQACRRGARDQWREARYQAGCAARALRFGAGRVGEHDYGMAAWDALEECIAFRAAARAK